MGNRTAAVKTNTAGTVVENRKYVYNESNQLAEAVLCDGKTTRKVQYTYDDDGNLTGEYSPTDRSLTTYTYTVENRLEAVYTGTAYSQTLQMAAAYDGDGNRVYQMNYNPDKDEDFSDYYCTYNSCDYKGTGIRLRAEGEVSSAERELLSLITASGAITDSSYELIEYINDVNREYAEVLVEQNINGTLDTAYVYGAAVGAGSDRLSLDHFDSTGYYLYDPRGSVTGITNEEGQIYQSYCYSVFGEITFGASQYENEYTYNGESYNPNIKSQYLRARYYCVVTADFLTEDSYLGNIREPLTLNRYNYCVGNPLNYVDPSGNIPFFDGIKDIIDGILDAISGFFSNDKPEAKTVVGIPIPPTPTPAPTEVPEFSNLEGESCTFGESYLEIGASVSESKTNAEDCILLDEEHCKVKDYEITYIVEFLKKFESFRVSPYYATAKEEENGTLTIGYGHVITSAEKDIYVTPYVGKAEVYVMTEEDATKLLKKDIKSHFPSDIIDEVLKVHGPLTQNQLDALVALAFNNPDFNIKESPKFTRILVNENYLGEDFDQMVVDEFMTYNKQGGEILGGLVKRSTAEAIMFLENNYFTEYDDLYSNPDVLEEYKNFLKKYSYDDLIKYIK